MLFFLLSPKEVILFFQKVCVCLDRCGRWFNSSIFILCPYNTGERARVFVSLSSSDLLSSSIWYVTTRHTLYVTHLFIQLLHQLVKRIIIMNSIYMALFHSKTECSLRFTIQYCPSHQSENHLDLMEYNTQPVGHSKTRVLTISYTV